MRKIVGKIESIYGVVYPRSLRREESRSTWTASLSAAALPHDHVDKGFFNVRIIENGKIAWVDREVVDYFVISGEQSVIYEIYLTIGAKEIRRILWNYQVDENDRLVIRIRKLG